MLRQSEIIILFLAEFDGPPLRPELAAFVPLFVRQELFLTNRVMPALLLLINLAVVKEALQNSAHTRLVQIVGSRSPAIEFHIKLRPKRDELFRNRIDELLRLHPFALRRLLDFLAMLINPGQKENFVTLQLVKSREDVGQHLLVGMTDMRRRVRIIDRRRDKESLSHYRVRIAERTAKRNDRMMSDLRVSRVAQHCRASLIPPTGSNLRSPASRTRSVRRQPLRAELLPHQPAAHPLQHDCPGPHRHLFGSAPIDPQPKPLAVAERQID